MIQELLYYLLFLCIVAAIYSCGLPSGEIGVLGTVLVDCTLAILGDFLRDFLRRDIFSVRERLSALDILAFSNANV